MLAEDGSDGGKAAQHVPPSSPVDDLLIEVGMFLFLGLSIGELHQFRTVYDIDASSNSPLSQVCPHRPCQWASIGIHKVGFPDQEGVAAKGGPHAAHHFDLAIVRFLQQGAFWIQRVDGIDDQIDFPFKDLSQRLLVHKEGEDLKVAFGIYRPYAFCRHFGFQPAQAIIRRKYLSIEIRDSNGVEIDDPQRADAAAHQRFQTHAPHSTQSNQHDSLFVQ